MNNVSILSRTNKYLRKTVNVKNIKGGRHLEFNEKSALFRERGIVDMWCYTHPETGDPMLYLENENGGLIREFNLRNQLDQIRNYFIKANATKNKVLAMKHKKDKLDKQCKEFDELITGKNFYVVNGKQFFSYTEAKEEALKLKPELRQVVEERDELLEDIRTRHHMPYVKEYIDFDLRKRDSLKF